MRNYFSSPKRAILWMSLSDSEIKISALCRKRLRLPFVAWTTSQFIYFLGLFTFSGSPAHSSLTSSVYCCKKRSPVPATGVTSDLRDQKAFGSSHLSEKTGGKEKKKIPFSGEFYHWPAAGATDGSSPSLGLNVKLLFIPGELQDSQISMERGDEGEGHP